MSDQLPAQPAGSPGALRILAVVAACLGVAALAGAAFVLSYPGLHAVALQAHVSPRLARGYPLIFDVLLVVVLAAALALRGAGWPSRLLAWLMLLALLTAAAGADALHAAGRRLPARPAAVTAAVLPWALLLIAFVLLLAMLRHARLRRLASERAGVPVTARPQADAQVPSPLSTQPLVPGFAARPAPPPGNDTMRLVVSGQAAGDTADWTYQGQETEPGFMVADDDLDAGVDLLSDHPAGDSADEDMHSDAQAFPARAHDDEHADDSGAGAPIGPPGHAPASDADGNDPEMPVFHRIWSTPVPPAAESD